MKIVFALLLSIFCTLLQAQDAQLEKDLDQAKKFYEKKDFDKVMPLLENNFEAMSRLYMYKRPDLILEYMDMLIACYKSKNYPAEVLQQFEAARKQLVAQKKAVSLNEQAQEAHKKGDSEKAVSLMKQVLTVYEEGYGKNSPGWIGSASSLARLYLALDRNDEGISQFKEALFWAEKKYGANSEKCKEIQQEIEVAKQNGAKQEAAQPKIDGAVQSAEIAPKLLPKLEPVYAKKMCECLGTINTPTIDSISSGMIGCATSLTMDTELLEIYQSVDLTGTEQEQYQVGKVIGKILHENIADDLVKDCKTVRDAVAAYKLKQFKSLAASHTENDKQEKMLAKIENLRKLLANNPEPKVESVIYMTIGMSYEYLGDDKNAKENYMKAEKLKPSILTAGLRILLELKK